MRLNIAYVGGVPASKGPPPAPGGVSSELRACVFCFPEEADGRLDFSRFAFPVIREVQCQDTTAIIVCCDCCPQQERLRSLYHGCVTAPTVVCWTAADAAPVCADCIHVQALRVSSMHSVITAETPAIPETIAQHMYVIYGFHDESRLRQYHSPLEK